MKAFYLAFLLLLIAMSVNSRRRRNVFKYEKRDASKENGLAREAFLSDSVVLYFKFELILLSLLEMC